MASSHSCTKCGNDFKKAAIDGGCPKCLMIAFSGTDYIILDERGNEVWAGWLATRYRKEMQQWLR